MSDGKISEKITCFWHTTRQASPYIVSLVYKWLPRILTA